MTEKEFNELQAGDVIRNKGTSWTVYSEDRGVSGEGEKRVVVTRPYYMVLYISDREHVLRVQKKETTKGTENE